MKKAVRRIAKKVFPKSPGSRRDYFRRRAYENLKKKPGKPILKRSRSPFIRSISQTVARRISAVAKRRVTFNHCVTKFHIPALPDKPVASHRIPEDCFKGDSKDSFVIESFNSSDFECTRRSSPNNSLLSSFDDPDDSVIIEEIEPIDLEPEQTVYVPRQSMTRMNKRAATATAAAAGDACSSSEVPKRRKADFFEPRLPFRDKNAGKKRSSANECEIVEVIEAKPSSSSAQKSTSKAKPAVLKPENTVNTPQIYDKAPFEGLVHVNASNEVFVEAGRFEEFPAPLPVADYNLEKLPACAPVLDDEFLNVLAEDEETTTPSGPAKIWYRRGKSAADQPGLWADLCEVRSDENLGSTDLHSLMHWMARWRRRVEKVAFEERRAKRKRSRPAAADDNDDDYDPSTDDSDLRDLSNPMVVCGPTGCGKTRYVHFAAKKALFNVVEVSVSVSRSGKALKAVLDSALSNHTVKPASIQNFFSPGRPVKADKKACSKSLILIDDADVWFEKESGYWQYLSEACAEAKVPIVLTCTDLDAVTRHLVAPAMETFFVPAKSQNSLARILRYFVKGKTGLWLSKQLISHVVTDSGQDLRRALNTLQFICAAADLPIRMPRSPAPTALDSRVLARLDATMSSCSEPVNAWLDGFSDEFLARSDRPQHPAVAAAFARGALDIRKRPLALDSLPLLSVIHRAFCARRSVGRRVLHPFDTVGFEMASYDRTGRLKTFMNSYLDFPKLDSRSGPDTKDSAVSRELEENE